ncbi:MAG: triose-phosphate isomerase [Acidobacteriota bacterium]|nr:triose-phosphate isomerase [Acidobacteriota bacterium]
MTRYYVLGNWKSNGTIDMIDTFTSGFNHPEPNEDLAYGLALPFHLLHHHKDFGALALGAQNVSSFREGAFTGEITAGMLGDTGCRFCLVGHSERRQYFKETVKETATKLKRLLAAEIFPIFCVGETLEEREAGMLRMVLKEQLAPMDALEEGARFAVAYEPVWAIGTGVAATPKDVKEAHFLIKRLLSSSGFGETPVLYGGSVKPKNAKSLAEIGQLDGFLVGGASLKPDDFQGIVTEFSAGKKLT